MAKYILTVAVLVSIMLTAGCSPEPNEELLFKPDPTQVAMFEQVGMGTPREGEVDVVEQMALDRSEYRQSLEVLVDFYRTTGDATKLGWAQKELQGLHEIAQYRYLMTAETVDATLQPTDSIPEADALYNEAMDLYRSAGKFIVIKDAGKMRLALTKFNEVIGRYPTSDKIDNAAYRAGRIYEHFKDYEIAVVYYQRTFQWDPATRYPARYRAALVTDHRLHKRSEALTLYKMAIEYESRFNENTEYAKQRVLALTRIDRETKMEVKETKFDEPAEPQDIIE